MTLGVFETAARGSGFLRRPEASYLPASGDVYVGERVVLTAQGLSRYQQ